MSKRYEASDASRITGFIALTNDAMFTQTYAQFIAYLYWRIPQIMEVTVKEFCNGARVPDDFNPIKSDEPEEPIEQPPEFDEAQVTAHALTVRSGPNKSFFADRYVRKGDVVKIYEIIEGWARISPDKLEWVSTIHLKAL